MTKNNDRTIACIKELSDIMRKYNFTSDGRDINSVYYWFTERYKPLSAVQFDIFEGRKQ